ncbi:MAG: D-alanyl-D-alanine carboxypeptidase family protein [Solirubrobacteraceae bacterium]
MPYTLLQGGRRRRRRFRPAAATIVLAVAATLVLAPSADVPAPAPDAPDLPLESGTAPLAGGGTAPSPLAVRLDDPRDAVHLKLRRPPRSGLLFDIDTGRVLWRHDPERVLPIASLTKMMTALVVVDRLPEGANVPITRKALDYRGSGVGLLPRGKRIGVSTMLHGLMLPSGNDAAIALAQRAAGSVPRFVRLMNERALQMGLACTRFSSPHGLRNRGSHSCAPDLAALARAVLREPRLARIVRRRSAVLPFPIKGRKLFLYNNNPLLRSGYRGATGLKTGYTRAAGRCLVGTARRGGVKLGVVLLDSPDPGTQARKLLDRGFARSGS